MRMRQIDYYLSTISPWCYLAGDRLERIAARHGAQITYRPLDLMQLFDRTGGTRPQRHTQVFGPAGQFLVAIVNPRGVAVLRPDVPMTNMAPSSYAVIAAQEAGGDVGGLVQGFLRARFADGRDIAEDGVIREVLPAHGFDPALADTGLFVGAETYARNLERAVEAGVFGAPFYHVLDTGQKFWGQDRLDFLERHLATL